MVGLSGARCLRWVALLLVALTTGPVRPAAIAAALEPLPAPADLVATLGARRVTLTWSAVTGATSYRVFRSTTGTFGTTPVATTSNKTYTNTGLTVGTTYFYRIVARDGGGESPPSATVSATPIAPPAAPTALSAVGGDRLVTVTWSAVPGATSYRLYRSLIAGRYSGPPTFTLSPSTTTFTDSGRDNGPLHFYTIIAANSGGNSARSNEVSAYTEGPPLVVDPATTAAFRLLRQATWGPKPGDLERVKLIGHEAFIAEQFSAPPSQYPDALIGQSTETLQHHVVSLALTGPDQLRQRVAWALHKIWVVSALDGEAAPGMVSYLRLLLDHAFGNYRDLMEAMTLNPAMGNYLSMLGNRSRQASGAPANENYARELMQLFTIGTARLNPDGSPQLNPDGSPVAAFTQDDVAALARILTGWTYGDGDEQTSPASGDAGNYAAPMEVDESLHDAETKRLLGVEFPAGATARSELERALDLLFRHPNVGPFVAEQLIKQLVTSNPSRPYVRDVAAAFNDNGQGVRGDLPAVVRAILLHPEAAAAHGGKFSEPLLFVTSLLRQTNTTIVGEPRGYLSAFVAELAAMGQRILSPPTVFSYFTPGFALRGSGAAAATAPELQILTDQTVLRRANFLAEVIGGLYGPSVVMDLSPLMSRAVDPVALVDYCNEQFWGGRMTAPERTAIIDAVRRTSLDSPALRRVQTALYLTFVVAQTQVDR